MADKLRVELPLLLPDVPDVADGCVQRLVAMVSALDGVAAAHVVTAAGAPALLCVHYDRARLSLARIRDLVAAAGAGITGQIGHRLWQIGGEMHPRRAQIIEQRLAQVAGVLDVGVSASGILRLEYDRAAISDAQLAAALRARGAEPLRALAPAVAARPAPGHAHRHRHRHADPHGHPHGHPHRRGWLDELPFAIAAGVCLGAGLAIQYLAPGAPAWLPVVAYGLACGFGGFFTVQEVVAGLRVRRFEIDSLMLVAAAGAISLGAWAEAALLLFLFSLGHSLEHGALRRAQSAIAALAQLVPETAMVRREGVVQTVATADLGPGDVLLVRPHQRLAADGFVLAGRSSVDQSALTGESMPADKVPVADAASARAAPQLLDASARVFAGSFNGSGVLEVEVLRAAGQSTLARVVQLIAEAETQRSASERFSTRIERIFVPAVLILAVLLMFAWVVVAEPFSASFYRAMAVLVAASPCALAISTPSAILSGVARAAQGGVLVKGGGPLEQLARARLFAFDKTGTLTRGEPQIRSLAVADGATEAEVVQTAVVVEEWSEHPLARAIVRDGRTRLGAEVAWPAVQGATSLAGHGLRATVAGRPVWVGRAPNGGGASDWARAQAAAMRARGETVVAVCRDGQELGLIGLQDRPRAEAAQAVRDLRRLAAARIVLLSGDNQAVADAVATDLGLDAAHGDLLPEDKLRRVQAMRADGVVAMIGDGVNDAPALAAADVGIAMAAAGSDIALEMADIALLGDRLQALPFAVTLSRRVQATIRQNICISLAVVAVLVPATIFGLRIGPAVAVHEGSTLLVVLNALRLLAVPLPAARRAAESVPAAA